MAYEIYHANDTNLRSQITAHLRTLAGLITTSASTDWPIVKKSIELDETFTIPEGYQLLVYQTFTFIGEMTIDGELVILEETA